MQYLGSDDAGVSSFSLQDFEPSFGSKLNASVREAWLESYGPVAADWAGAKMGGDGSKRLSAAEAMDYAKTEGGGVKLKLTPKDGEYTASQWSTIVSRQRELAAVKDVRERTPWDMGSVIRGGAMFGAGIVDPINLATAFVPWTRVLGAANGLRAAAMAESALTRAGARATLGAADAGISTLALEPFYAYARNELGDDYGALDSMANIAFGTAFGGGLHVLGGAAGDAFKAYRARGAVPPAVITPELATAAKTMTPEQRIEAGIAPEAARAGMPEIVEARSDDPFGPLTAEELTPNTGKNYNPPPTLTDIASPVGGAPAAADLPPIAAAPTKRRDLLDALKSNGGISPALARDAGGENGMRLNRKLPGVVKKTGLTEYDQIAELMGEQGFLRPGTEPGSQDAIDQAQDMVNRAFNGDNVVRWEDRIADAERQRDMDYRDYLDSMQRPDASASELVTELAPETREATLRAAVAQAVDGRMVDVDAIIGMDESLQSHTLDDATAAADRNFEPESAALADMDAAADVQARVDAAPKWEAVKDAEAALAEADTLLADTVKAGDQAFKYARAQADEARDLIITHNLTAANLMHAKKMGGIAVPSLAVTKKDTPLTGFGEITLIGSKEMADPKGYAGTKVFGADIYSPRYPQVTYDISSAQTKKLTAEFGAGEKAVGKQIDLSEVQGRGAAELVNSPAVMWQFLTEKGITPDVQTKAAFSSERRGRLKKFGFEKYFGETDHQMLMRDEGFQRLAVAEQNDAYTQGGMADLVVDFEDAKVNDFSRLMAMSRNLAYDMKKVGAGEEPDAYATRDALRKQIRGDLEQEFNAYVASKFEAIGAKEKIFQGFTNGGDRKYTPHTMENVVKILKKELRGGENFSYGVGSLRAKYTPQFKSIDQIRGAKGRLIDKASFEAVKKEVDDELVAISDQLGLSIDQTIEVFEDAPKLGVPRAIDRAFKDYKKGGVADDAVQQRVAQFLNRLRNLPTEYFEAKILRDVSPAEFKGAVVPDDLSADAMAYLKQNVENIRTYKRGDEASRAAAVQSFEDLRFSRGDVGGGTPESLDLALRSEFGPSTERLLSEGRVQIVATPDDIPGGPHPGDVKGATAPDGTVYIVASNVSEIEARGMLLHEVGVHVGMERMLGSDVFQSVLGELDDAIGRGEAWAQAARSSVPADTPAGLVREEQLAYLVQNAPELPIVKRIIAAVRAWVYQNFEFARGRLTLGEADFVALAVSALHEAARGERSVDGVLAFARRKLFPADKLEQSGKFKTGQPVTFDFVHNTESATDLFGKPKKGDRFGRDIEPSGRYVVATEGPANTTGMPGRVSGSLTFDRPLVLNVETWKQDLRDHYGTSGKRLSKALIADGYDGVVTVDKYGTSEILDLTTFDESKARYSRGETPDTSTTKDELTPYNDAVKRARSFASVLRAAADKLDNDAQATAAMRAAMPDITPQEINDLLGGLRRQVKGLRGMARTARTAVTSEDTAALLQTDAMKAADELANNLELAAVIEKRNAALNINARLKAMGYINQFRDAKLDFEGFRGLLVGTERKRAGGRISVDAEQKNFRGEWLGGMISDLEKGGLMRSFASGEFDREVYVALYNLGRDGVGNEKLPKEAVAIAEVVNKYQTDARNTRNRFGAWIRDLQGYIVRQSHDMFKIREAGEQKYKAEVLPLLDVRRSMRDFEGSVDDFLTRVYDDFAAGSHMKTPTGEDDLAAFGAGSSLARKVSASRVLYFKDGDAAYQYNQKFGQGKLAESVLGGIDNAAKSAGLLKLLGTNPQATVDRLFAEYAESLRGDPARRAKFLSHRKELENLLATVDGTSNIPGNVTAAQISSFFRSWQTMSKLGGMLISSVTDLTNYAAELRFGQDKNLLTGTLEGVGALTRGRSTGEKRAVLNSLGVFHESTLGAVFARFDSPELMGGKTSWAMQQFFKLTGINWWTESLRDGYALAHASYVSSNAGKAFDKLPDSLRDMLGLYNIDAGKWDVLRLANTQQADGRMYITPDGLRTVPRAALANYITQVGRTPNDAAIANLQDDLASALRTMTIDRMHHAVIEPGARTRAFMQRGTQPGTVSGELLRFVGQFKSFPVALVQMTLGREIYGRGYDTLGDYVKRGKGDMLGLASFIALSTAMGYAAMSAKDLLRGKNPRPVDDPRTWAAAMIQGGGLGLYGDFLFGKYNRMGGSLTGSMAGPVANLGDTVADLWTRIRTGDDFGAVAFNAALANTPFANIFYTRIALDYLILYKIQEALNPGFLRRMEKRVERENGQTFYMPPSQVTR